MDRIYMDHSATTPVAGEVIEVMLQSLREHWGNPSSQHVQGNEARRAIDTARKQVARLIGADHQEIIFTSGGTEACNLAIIGAAREHRKRGKHVITSQVEHYAVLKSFIFLEKQGFELTCLPVNRFGQVNIETLRENIRDDTILLSIMHANNEIGTMQPVSEIARVAKEKGIIFHIDAVQTAGRIPVDVRELEVDLLSLSAHKFYGPKGVGALFVRNGISIEPVSFGGGQERERRSGTENVAGIAGMGRAAEMAAEKMAERYNHIQALGRYLINRVQQEIPHAYLSGHHQERLPGHASFVLPGVDGTSLLTLLNEAGIAASGSSACSSNSFAESHVLKATGLRQDFLNSALRLSMGKDNTFREVDRTVEILAELITRQRLLSMLGT